MYVCILSVGGRAVYRHFPQGGKFGEWIKEAKAYVRCYTLHLLGGKNDTRGWGQCPSSPTALGGISYPLLFLLVSE